MNWISLALAGVVGWFARDAAADEEIGSLDRDLWVQRARDAAWELEQTTGDEYEWPDERLDDE